MQERPDAPLQAAMCPPWRVMAVFDPDGNGGDFAYTIGLADLGHPELHMWARPTDGDDPGHDFRFSSVDLASILDHFARMLLSGDLQVGDQEEIGFDEGLNRACITIAEPVDPHRVDAFGVASGSLVIPLRWELRRDPVGENLPVSADVAADVERLLLDWNGVVARLGGRIPPGRPDTDPDQEFGPWSAVIESVRSAIALLGSSGQLSRCIDHLEDRRTEIGYATGVAAALARRHGRQLAFEAAESAGGRDADSLIDLGDELFRDLGEPLARDALPALRHIVGFILGGLYGLLVVRDLLDEQRRDLMLGPINVLCVLVATGPVLGPGSSGPLDESGRES